MDPSHYNTALALYFVSYVIFEVPANVSKATRGDQPRSLHARIAITGRTQLIGFCSPLDHVRALWLDLLRRRTYF